MDDPIDSGVTSSPESHYDTSFAVDNLQRYFEFYLDEFENMRGRCRLCNSTYSRKNYGTTKLRGHLKKCDPKAFELFDKPKQRKSLSAPSTPRSSSQPLINDIFQTSKKWKNKDACSIAMDKNILRFICLNLEPLNFTEHRGLEMITDSRYTLKGRNFMTSLLEKEYLIEINRLKEKYATVDFIALTADTWSSKNQSKHFLSITAHSISENYVLDFDLLACVPMYDRGTGVNIAKHLNDTLTTLDIPLSKITIILRDGAKSMIKAANELEILSVDCFIHKLQLCVREALDPYNDDIEKVREISRRFNTSSNFHRDFMARSKKQLIKDVKTRWNSTHLMIQRIVESRAILAELTQTTYTTQSGKFNLPDLRFNELSKIVDGLQSASDFTKDLSNRYTFLSVVLPIYEQFKSFIVDGSEEDALDATLQIQHNIGSSLKHRMEKMAEKERSYLLVCTMIDPRFKDCLFDRETRALAKEKLITAVNELNSQINVSTCSNQTLDSPPHKIQKKASGVASLEELLRERSNRRLSQDEDDVSSVIKMEIDAYLKQNTVSLDGDILKYWKASSFVNLKLLARKYLCAPPSSIESERVFSAMGNVYDDKRFRLSEEHAHQQLFLRYIYLKDADEIY